MNARGPPGLRPVGGTDDAPGRCHLTPTGCIYPRMTIGPKVVRASAVECCLSGRADAWRQMPAARPTQVTVADSDEAGRGPSDQSRPPAHGAADAIGGEIDVTGTPGMGIRAADLNHRHRFPQ